MANRGTSFEEDDRQIRRDGGVLAHWAGVARRASGYQRAGNYTRLLAILHLLLEAKMEPPARMTPQEWHSHVRRLADSRCQNKHRDVYDSMVCIGPSSTHFGPPCDECLEETRNELEQKRGKAHGTELSPEEAADLRRRLGIK